MADSPRPPDEFDPNRAEATARRKDEHLAVNLAGPVTGDVDAGFGAFRFEPQAMPDLDLAEVSTATSLFGRSMKAPLLISSMTGGTPSAARLNALLAELAEEKGLAIGLGSGRVLLEDENAAGFDIRHRAPSIPLLCNLGAAQLNRATGVDDCRRLIELTRADALVLHLNALQEAIQPEGQPRFRGLLGRLELLCARLGAPVIVKEVGFGIAADVAAALFEVGVAAVDVAGAGGTSWTEVERHRLTGNAARVAQAFRSWGIPTAYAITAVRAVAPGRVVIASGGVRDGMDVAIALALGADLVGLAGPFLRAANQGEAAAAELADELTTVLRITMFAVGARDLRAFRASPRLVARHGFPESNLMRSFSLLPVARASGDVARIPVSQLSKVTGLSPVLIRAWERRYHFPAPARTTGGHRRYTPREVELVRRAAVLIRSGLRAADAISRARSEVSLRALGQLDAAPRLAELLLDSDPSRPLDYLRATSTALGFEVTLEEFVMPALRELGEGWAAGRVSVSDEHVATGIVLSWLGAVRAELPATGLGPPAYLIATPEGEEHSICAWALEVLLRMRRVSARALGASVPATDLLAEVARQRPRGLVLGITRSRLKRTLLPLARTLADTQGPAPILYVGGPGAVPPLPAGLTRLAGTLTVAASWLANAAQSEKAPPRGSAT